MFFAIFILRILKEYNDIQYKYIYVNLFLGVYSMSKIKTAYELIGNTPIVSLDRYKEKMGLKSNIFAKLEWYSMTGSVKDRIALAMINDAEQRGVLNPGGTIIEPTSGNTGIGLAAIGATRGYKVIIVMPETMSKERVNILKAYGAEVILTDGAGGMSGAIKRAAELNYEIKGSVILDQFKNKANVEIHRKTTGMEIITDMKGNIDIFVSGVGTAGTVVGAGTTLKKYNRNIEIVAVEPKTSAVLSKKAAGKHKIQGIGAGLIPPLFEYEIVDRILTVADDEAFETVNTLSKTEGLLIGLSSGAALYAATVIAKEQQNKNIVVVFPDSGEKYLSTGVFD